MRKRGGGTISHFEGRIVVVASLFAFETMRAPFWDGIIPRGQYVWRSRGGSWAGGWRGGRLGGRLGRLWRP